MQQIVDVGPIAYPESDGEPLGESDWHVTETLFLLGVLRRLFAGVPDVYVASDLFLYYEQGNPRAVVAADVMVVRGVDKRKRRTYLLWEEGPGPCCVIEVTSRSSRFEDMGTKRAIYASLGVREYFVFDPLREYLNPPIVRFRLTDTGEYVRDDGVEFESAELGVLFRAEQDRMRPYVLSTGERLLDPEEIELARLKAEQAFQREQQARLAAEQARQSAEAELARLRAELERLRRPG
jgi:Uma2 family endonuclease